MLLVKTEIFAQNKIISATTLLFNDAFRLINIIQIPVGFITFSISRCFAQYFLQNVFSKIQFAKFSKICRRKNVLKLNQLFITANTFTAAHFSSISNIRFKNEQIREFPSKSHFYILFISLLCSCSSSKIFIIQPFVSVDKKSVCYSSSFGNYDLFISSTASVERMNFKCEFQNFRQITPNSYINNIIVFGLNCSFALIKF